MTKHKYDCKMAFGKKDVSCPRCQELLNGAPTRNGWQKDYFTKKQEQAKNLQRDLVHLKTLIADNPNQVITFMDW